MDDFDWFTGVFLAFSLVFLVSIWFKYGDQLKKVVELQPLNASVIDQAFPISVQIVNSIIQKLPNELKLQFYALYKQSTEGECNREEPSKLSLMNHAKWSAWNDIKGKSQITAKREYFEMMYKEIVVKFNVNVILYENESQVPEALKNQAMSTNQAPSMDFNVQSKLEGEDFDEELHGDPDELFNKFDLTQKSVDVEAIKTFITSHKVDLNKQNENGMTFLNFAVDNTHTELVKMLIEEFKADVNIRDDMGYTPLHSAAMSGDTELASYLIAHGADKEAKSTDEDEETPFDLAESEEMKELLHII